MRWVPCPRLRAPGELGVWEVGWGGTGPGAFRLGQTLKWTGPEEWREAPGGERFWICSQAPCFQRDMGLSASEIL